MQFVTGSLKKKLIVVVVVLLLAMTGGLWWYFTKYINTPEYAVEMVQVAIEKHDKDKLYKYVDVDHFLDEAGNDLLDTLIASSMTGVDNNAETVSSIAMMFKSPVVVSLKTALDNYIEYGSLNTQSQSSEPVLSAIDVDVIVDRLGLTKLSFRGLDSMAIDSETGLAIAKVRVYQVEADQEYVFNVDLVQLEDGHWQVYELSNLREFIQMMHSTRQEQVKKYLNESADIVMQHDKNIAALEKKKGEIIASGSLGNNETRMKLKSCLEDEFLPDWEARKVALEGLEVPSAAGTMHRLRLKVCDLYIAYGKDYIRWLEDKKAATIRSAENNLKQAKNFEKDAELLTKQVTAHMR